MIVFRMPKYGFLGLITYHLVLIPKTVKLTRNIDIFRYYIRSLLSMKSLLYNNMSILGVAVFTEGGGYSKKISA